MQKVSFSFPPEMVTDLDKARGDLSRNQFVLRLLSRALRDRQEREFRRVTAEVYGDKGFAEQEEELTEDFLRVAPEAEL